MKTTLIAILTSLTLLLIATASHANELETAPNWNLETQADQPISLAQFQGKPVILHFWATWCPYCKKLQPKLVEMQKKYAQDGVVIVAISFNEDEGAMPQDMLNARGHAFMTAINGDNVATQYGVKGTPTTFYINKAGQVVFKSTSSNINDPRIELAVKEIIK